MTFAALIPIIIKYSVYLPQFAMIIDTIVKRIEDMKKADPEMTEEEVKNFLDVVAGNVWKYPEE